MAGGGSGLHVETRGASTWRFINYSRSVPGYLVAIAVFNLVEIVPSDAFARTWTVTVDGLGVAPTVQAGIDSAAVDTAVVVPPQSPRARAGEDKRVPDTDMEILQTAGFLSEQTWSPRVSDIVFVGRVADLSIEEFHAHGGGKYGYTLVTMAVERMIIGEASKPGDTTGNITLNEGTVVVLDEQGLPRLVSVPPEIWLNVGDRVLARGMLVPERPEGSRYVEGYLSSQVHKSPWRERRS